MKINNYKTYENNKDGLMASGDCKYYNFYCEGKVYKGGKIDKLKNTPFEKSKMHYKGRAVYNGKNYTFATYSLTRDITEDNIKDFLILCFKNNYNEAKRRSKM